MKDLMNTIEQTTKKGIETIATIIYYMVMVFIGAYIQMMVLFGIGWIVRWLFFPELL